MTLERQLLKEATTLTFSPWKAQVKWVSEKVKEYPHELDVIANVVRRMGWPFKVDYIAERIAKGKDLAERFNAILETRIITIAELKARIPIKWYFEEILKCSFIDNKTKCPFHDGKTNTSLVINPKEQIFTCFGGCQPTEGQEHLTGDVINAHQLAFNLPNLSEARQSLEQLAAGKLTDKAFTLSFAPTPTQQKEPRTSKVDTELLAHVLAEDLGESIDSANRATAADFAKFLLERILKPDDKPIVSTTLHTMRIGKYAREWLAQRPEMLQYLCCSTAQREDTWRRAGNIMERIFLDVEFDEMPLEDQLKVLWWLKIKKGWKLICITFSGSKSYHGLFYVRGLTEEQVDKMIQLAKSLGACAKSLGASRLVRFPGGMRREPPPANVRQEIIHLRKLTTR